MVAGAQTVHQFYKPLEDIDEWVKRFEEQQKIIEEAKKIDSSEPTTSVSEQQKIIEDSKEVECSEPTAVSEPIAAASELIAAESEPNIAAETSSRPPVSN